MPERGRSELNFRAAEPTDIRVASRNAQRATAQMEVLRARRMRATPCNSGRDVIDHDVDESVVTDPIRNLAEWIAAARQRIA